MTVLCFQLLCNFGADTEDIARILQGKKLILCINYSGITFFLLLVYKFLNQMEIHGPEFCNIELAVQFKKFVFIIPWIEVNLTEPPKTT
jgi:hypothetical protein